MGREREMFSLLITKVKFGFVLEIIAKSHSPCIWMGPKEAEKLIWKVYLRPYILSLILSQLLCLFLDTYGKYIS